MDWAYFFLGCPVLAMTSMFSKGVHSLEPMGESPWMGFKATDHTLGYYLADGIYPKCVTFVKPLVKPQGKEELDNTQVAVRKDVKRAFGVLQAQFVL
jgi:hypothetical protein